MKTVQNHEGFTLIELVMVIVVLGLLAAVAIPRFVDLSNDARAGANLGGIGCLRSAISARFSEELLRGVSAAPADVITAAGPALPASATAANLGPMCTSGLPTSLGAGTGAAAATCALGWSGMSPANPGPGAPGTQNWDICPGAAVGDPIRLTGRVAGLQ